ncbi:hypothetical protein EVAR_29020_1 [Eumeta japonica]|uniref:Uncharacterized protein n=1 Tax=Eumeta variegata TaxID=151549 RepID=A0A4C1W405_EUMVA|nr:hypothetical protein EVAR_29020_1 [Eumeta japonica]
MSFEKNRNLGRRQKHDRNGAETEIGEGAALGLWSTTQLVDNKGGRIHLKLKRAEPRLKCRDKQTGSPIISVSVSFISFRCCALKECTETAIEQSLGLMHVMRAYRHTAIVAALAHGQRTRAANWAMLSF